MGVVCELLSREGFQETLDEAVGFLRGRERTRVLRSTWMREVSGSSCGRRRRGREGCEVAF